MTDTGMVMMMVIGMATTTPTKMTIADMIDSYLGHANILK